MMTYKLRSGALLQDVTSSPAMLRRGKLHPRPETIRDIDDVRRIFRMCEASAGGGAPRGADAA